MNLVMNVRREALAKILAALVLSAATFVSVAGTAQAKAEKVQKPEKIEKVQRAEKAEKVEKVG